MGRAGRSASRANERPGGLGDMRSKKAPLIARCLVVGALAGCSSEGNILPKRERFTPAFLDASRPDDVAPEAAGDGSKPRDPNANCVKPGTPNNERGIGGYCESGPVDCVYEAGPRFCTA